MPHRLQQLGARVKVRVRARVTVRVRVRVMCSAGLAQDAGW